MEMGDHYAFADLRQLIAGRTAALFPTEEQFNGHRNLTTTTTTAGGTVVVGQQQQQQQHQQQHYEMLMLGRTDHHHHHRGGGRAMDDFCSSASHDHDHSTNPTTTSTTTNSNNIGSVGTGGFCGLLGMDGGSGGGYMQMINNIGMGNGGVGGGVGVGVGVGDHGGGENVHNNISRWPRQETLSLLEIRSHLDPKFKEANQKGPLWDEVSRIMAEEHGYQRSGKKCREKFENLYKYYKKTKEGKAGRQDGKHYRFFRQLEALYGGETTTTTTTTSNIHPNIASSASLISVHHDQTHAHHTHLGNLHQFQTHTSPSSQSYDHHKLSESLSLSNSSEFDTSSSEDNVGNDIDHDNNDDLITPTIAFMGNNNNNNIDHHLHDSMEKRKKKQYLMMMMKDNPISSHKRGGKRSWKTKIRDFVDSRMKKLMETQEAWLDKMLKTLEYKEQERLSREEEWRKKETARIEQEHKFWAKERAWFEARDAALMEALHRFTGTELKVTSPEELMATEVHHENNTENHNENGSCQNVERSNVYSSSTSTRWSEAEISNLIQLKSGLESKFQQCAGSSDQEAPWEDISVKMACLGYHRSAKNFQEKWESIDSYFRKTNEFNKKRRENSRTSPYYHQHLVLDSTYSHQGGRRSGFQGQGVDEQGPEIVGIQLNDGPSPSNSNAGTTGSNDHCFRFLMNEGENLWENYGMKLNKGGN